jgi:hypothetical protein
MAFIFLERHAKTNGFVFMEPSRQYREFAEECRRFGKIVLQMEMVWTKLAEEAEGQAVKDQD